MKTRWLVLAGLASALGLLLFFSAGSGSAWAQNDVAPVLTARSFDYYPPKLYYPPKGTLIYNRTPNLTWQYILPISKGGWRDHFEMQIVWYDRWGVRQPGIVDNGYGAGIRWTYHENYHIQWWDGFKGTGLEFGRKYYWRVRACHSVDSSDCSYYSGWSWFQVYTP